MDEGTCWAVVYGGCKELEHSQTTKQQQIDSNGAFIQLGMEHWH